MWEQMSDFGQLDVEDPERAFEQIVLMATADWVGPVPKLQPPDGRLTTA